MKKRFTGTQIIDLSKEAEAGKKVANLCCQHGISETTYYN